MATTMYLAEATRLKIRGANALSSSKDSGYIHAIGSWCGVIAEGIRGTGDDYNTAAVKGFPMSDGVGDGLGDLVLQGVYAVVLASGVAVSAAGDVLYGDVATNRVDDDTGNEILGWLWPQDDGTLSRAPNSDDPAWMQSLAGGEAVVYCRLAGFPKTGLV